MCIETLDVRVYAYNASTEGKKERQDSLGYRVRCFCKKKLLIILRQLVEFKEIFANYMHNKVAQASSDSL